MRPAIARMRGSSAGSLSEGEGDRTRGQARGSSRGDNGDGDRGSSATMGNDGGDGSSSDGLSERKGERER